MRPLIVWDNPDDAELMVNSLQCNGLEATWQRVETADGFKEALAVET